MIITVNFSAKYISKINIPSFINKTARNYKLNNNNGYWPCLYTAKAVISAVKVTHFLELVTVTVTFPKKELVTGKSYT